MRNDCSTGAGCWYPPATLSVYRKGKVVGVITKLDRKWTVSWSRDSKPDREATERKAAVLNAANRMVPK